MIVFPQGAVLRLSEAVSEGQILILKNARVQQEVACRVVSSKTNAKAKGYIEVEFFQAAPSFWGIGFPGVSDAPQADAQSRADSAVPKIPTFKPTAAPPSSPTQAPASSQQFSAPQSAPTVPAPVAAVPLPAPPSPMSTVDLNEAIAAAYAARIEAQRKPAAPVAINAPKPTDSNPDISGKLNTAGEVKPPAISAPEPVVNPAVPITHVEAKPQVIGKSKTDARSSTASREPAISPKPIAIADPIEPAHPESVGHSRSQSAPHQSTASVATLPAPSEIRKASSTSASREVESAFGRDMFSQSETISTSNPAGSKRSLVLIGVAAALILAAGGGTYWWKFLRIPRVSSSSALSSATPAATTPAVSVPQQPAASVSAPPTGQIDSQTAQNLGAAKKNGSAPDNATGSAAAFKPDKNLANPPARRPNVIGSSKIAAPSPRGGGNVKSAIEPAPDVLGNSSSVTQNASIGSALPGIGQPGAVPAPPTAVKPAAGGSSSVLAPRLISSVPAVYPKMAAMRGDTGTVVIDALVNELGRVTSTKIVSGPPTLQQSAIDAVMQQRYEPAKLNGKPTSAHVMVRIQFNK